MNIEQVQEVLIAPELAALLRIHIKTVYKLAESGVIPGKRIGRSWRFSRTDVLKFLSQNGNGVHGAIKGDP
jgi:excisionase family DNA binding protein